MVHCSTLLRCSTLLHGSTLVHYSTLVHCSTLETCSTPRHYSKIEWPTEEDLWKKLNPMTQTKRQTDRRTDIATLRLNRPSVAIQ